MRSEDRKRGEMEGGPSSLRAGRQGGLQEDGRGGECSLVFPLCQGC